ncbi:MAG: CBS domain-containing protein [Elusimicrobia bacterium]|nr:CBS domain-containing protein [Elusimicrobiota bacterium]
MVKIPSLENRNFIFLSELIGLPVFDNKTQKKIGTIQDLSATTKEVYPRITGLLVQDGKKYYFPWSKVASLEYNVVVVKDIEETDRREFNPTECDILLKETFWDKQIVNISGSNLVRVNDLHMLKENANLWVAHVDVGFRGLLRRLGWEETFCSVSEWLFSYKIENNLISWKFVQPTGTDTACFPMKLQLSHEKLSEIHPVDLAEILMDLGLNERITIFRSMNTVIAARTLQELPRKVQIELLESLTKEQVVNILSEMPVDEVVDLLGSLSEKAQHSILYNMKKDRANEIRSLLTHSEKVAGALMNTDFIAVPATWTVEQALNLVKERSKTAENLYYLYAVDNKETLVGALTLRQLFQNEPTRQIAEIMKKRVLKAKIDTNRKKVAVLFVKYNFNVLPVVDKQNKLKGIITIKDALEAAYPEIKEDAEVK